MLCYYIPFFSITTALLVRRGVNERLPIRKDEETGLFYSEHTFFNVHVEMLFQVLRDYSVGIPDFKKLDAVEIRFLYNGLRGELLKTTMPRDT